MSLYETESSVLRSFDEHFIPEEQLQAQWAELIELKKVIYEQFYLQGRPVSILDIGIGSARIPRHLNGIPEIWEMIACYDGIDNAEACISLSKKRIAELNIGDRVFVHLLQAHEMNLLNKKYDLVITTWFTAGNFYPENFDFDLYKGSEKRLDLSGNQRFDKVFSTAYQMLNPGGEIVLGACYIDNHRTREKQEAFYKKIGMTVITDAEDSFTATKEKFWSQRFTKEKIYTYFSFAAPGNIRFISLDTYDYAMQVRVKKIN